MYYMTDTIVSLRVDKKTHHQMKLHQEINWSAVLRRSIAQQLEKVETIDVERARRAAKAIDKIRQSGVFDRGRPGVEIIREWRDKRR